MKNKLFFVCFFLIIGFSFSYSGTIQISSFNYSGLIPIEKPIRIDSLNLEKKEYSDKILLTTRVDFDKVRTGKLILRADTSDAIPLEYAKDKALQLLSFNIDPDQYCKPKLRITSTEMFEVYINGKKEKSKETKEIDITRSSDVDLSLILEPRRYEVIIKLLASYKNFNKPEIKVQLLTDKKDAGINISLNEKRKITLNDILEGKRLLDFNLSSSGNYFTASYEQVYPGGKREVWHELRELKDNRLLFRFPASFQPYWMPSSDRLYYWKKGTEDSDFYLMDPVSLEEKVIFENIKINSVLISADEKYMLVHHKDNIPEEKGNLRRHLSPSDRSGAFRPRNVLYKYNFETGTFQPFSFGRRNVYATDISPDSKQIMFMITEEDLSKRLLGNTFLCLMDTETATVDTLANDQGISHAIFSPDGKKVLVDANAESFNKIGQRIPSGMISNTFDRQAFIIDLKTKEIIPITADFNPSIASMQWSKSDNHIYFRAEEEDREQVFRYNTNNKTFQKLDLKEDIIKKFRTAHNGSGAMYRGESASNAYRLYSYDTKNGAVRLLSDPYQEQLSEIKLGEMKDWDFQTEDGTPIKGRYYLPPGFDPSRKYPLIVYYYGGTTPTQRVFESRYPLHVYAAMGYVVYTLQPSGTIGFGQEFSARHVNAWGKQTADEIIEGTKKFREEHKFIHKDKIGCIGASYGGFMTQYLLTRTDIFTTAVSHAGISALSSYWGEGFWGYSYSEIASTGSYPWNNPQLYTEQSPLFNADKINTPLLLLHGTVDTNVPVGESMQMYTALKLLGKEVEFIEVKGENHAIAGYRNRINWNDTIFAWFAKWLKNEPEWWNGSYPN